jgi:hypothetical protein
LDPFVAGRREAEGHGVSFLDLDDYTGLELIIGFIDLERNLWSTQIDYDKIQNRENVIDPSV